MFGFPLQARWGLGATTIPFDARRAVVAAHLAPRPLQHVPAVDLVVERVETSFAIGDSLAARYSLC